MKVIPLTQGQVALVDDADYEALSTRKWNASNLRGKFYAQSCVWLPDVKKCTGVYMHQVLLPKAKARGLVVAHLDGNGLNNQRANLRAVTRGRAQANNVRPRGKSGFRGVSFMATCTVNPWRARISAGTPGKFVNIGFYPTKEEAAAAYDAAATKRWGTLARLNFPKETT